MPNSRKKDKHDMQPTTATMQIARRGTQAMKQVGAKATAKATANVKANASSTTRKGFISHEKSRQQYLVRVDGCPSKVFSYKHGSSAVALKKATEHLHSLVN